METIKSKEAERISAVLKIITAKGEFTEQKAEQARDEVNKLYADAGVSADQREKELSILTKLIEISLKK